MKKMSIRLKLELSITLLLTVISLFIFLYFPGKFKKLEMESLIVRARSIGEMTAFSSSSALFFHDEESARESLNTLKANTDITFVAVVDESGDIFVSSMLDQPDAFIFNPTAGHVFMDNGVLQMTTPVKNDGMTIGHVVMGFSLEGIRQSERESRKIISLISFLILALGIAAVMIISTVITTPLSRMVTTVRNIEAGDLTQRAAIGSGDEIDELAQSFNHMVQSLEASYAELEAFNRNLEGRVKERTALLNREVEIRKKAQMELLRAKDYAERLVDLTPIAIFSVDDHQRITSWNRKAAEITGYGLDEVTGRKCTDILGAACIADCKLLTKETTQSTEAAVSTIQKKNGQDILISKYAAPLYDSDGNFIGGIECFEDITYRNRLEEELQIRQRMDSLGNLAGGIAHDFNNLLMGIIGNLDMIKIESEGLRDNHREYIEESYKLSYRAAKLIKDIQALTSGSLTQLKAFDIYDTAQDVFSILSRTTDRLIEKHVDIEPGRFYVYANDDQIHQVLLNLGTNAVNALTERGLKAGDYIRISARDYIVKSGDVTGLPDGEYVHIMFEDNGTGMTEKVRRHAFDPLFTTSRKSSIKGQGLGLAMVYNIITKNHEGHISIDTTEGKGTTFNIWLPKGNSAQKKDTEPITEIQMGKGTILIVEDEETLRNVAKKALEMHGYTVITAFDGLNGMEQFDIHNEDIDLVILDLSMPRMSGSMLYKYMRNARADIRIIISSGHGDDDLNEFTNLNGVLQKPYSIPTLLTTIRNILRNPV